MGLYRSGPASTEKPREAIRPDDWRRTLLTGCHIMCAPELSPMALFGSEPTVLLGDGVGVVPRAAMDSEV